MIGLSAQNVDVDRLRTLVEQRLCEIGHLEQNQFPMTQRELNRGGRTCGFYFCVHGPRSVKLTAIFDFATEMVMLYGSDGVRRESVAFPTQSAGEACQTLETAA